MTRLSRAKRITAAYSLLDELMASNTKPMPQQMQTYQLTRIYESLHSLEQAPVPTLEDWRTVSDAVNMLETLIKNGQCEDASGLLVDAITALAQAGMRHLAGANIRLDAKGIQAVRGVVQDYATVLAALPHRAMIACHRETEKRTRGIENGSVKTHDVVVKL